MVYAPSYSPIISMHSFPFTIDTLPSLPMPTPAQSIVWYESPLWNSSYWHQQKVAEQSAHLEEDDPQMILIAHCELCDIGIGPGHIEQDLYVYHNTGQDVSCIIGGSEQYIRADDIRALGGHWFLCCGGCARRRTRQLPESCCIFDTRHWTTNLLTRRGNAALSPLAIEDFPRIWQQKDAYLRTRLAPFDLSLSWFLRKLAHIPVPPSPVLPHTLDLQGMAPSYAFAQ